jgi:hypothetical protein
MFLSGVDAYWNDAFSIQATHYLSLPIISPVRQVSCFANTFLFGEWLLSSGKAT